MTKMLLVPIALATLLGGCATSRYDDGGWGYYDQRSYSQYGNYDYNNPDPSVGAYYPERYHRTDRRYRARRLNDSDRVYRGNDGRYYCRRSDGTTGLIVGAIAGGVLGNIIAPGDSKTLGTILGALGGAAVGRLADNGVKCQ
jgi:hypothetical protein